MRMDISDDENIPTDTPYYAPASATPYRHPHSGVSSETAGTRLPRSQSTPSETSDMVMTGSAESGINPEASGNSVAPTERILDNLVSELRVVLTPAQKATYASVRGMLTTGRDALLATAALVAGQRHAISETNDALEKVRDETAVKLQSLQDRVITQEEAMDRCLTDSIRVLRNFGSTEAHLVELTRAMSRGSVSNSPQIEIPLELRDETRSPASLAEFQREADAVLTPRGPNETGDSYLRHAAASARRHEQTATAFAPATAHTLGRAPSVSAALFAKTARFEDMGSISTAHVRPFQRYTQEDEPRTEGAASAFTHATSGFTSRTIGDKQLTFFQEKEAIIRAVVGREVGEKLSLPTGIRLPKTDGPPRFAGADDLDDFMQWVELLCSWLRGYLICGHEEGVDAFRITMTKSYLSGAALEWFILNVNSSHYVASPSVGFADVLCGLLRRFITTANAQRATKAFDLVCYDHAKGPEAFAESLIRRANQMNHVPNEFAVRQRFLAGLPATIRYKMKVDRELSAEYSSLDELRAAARHSHR
ncbi:hypothetical protein B0H13DRAFT_2371562 [Mycena leptocephala]|nr:hypothetical protein B0H13DRAFT_2371562 [Mycena leptocephala]